MFLLYMPLQRQLYGSQIKRMVNFLKHYYEQRGYHTLNPFLLQ